MEHLQKAMKWWNELPSQGSLRSQAHFAIKYFGASSWTHLQREQIYQIWQVEQTEEEKPVVQPDSKPLKKCKIVNGKFSYYLEVDGRTINFDGGSNADYFKEHYESLGYEVEMDLEAYKKEE